MQHSACYDLSGCLWGLQVEHAHMRAAVQCMVVADCSSWVPLLISLQGWRHRRVQSLLRNKIQGVTRGYLVYLRMIGIGYRASVEGQVTFYATSAQRNEL